MLIRNALLGLTLGTLLAGTAIAEEIDAEAYISYREDLMQSAKAHNKALSSILKGKIKAPENLKGHAATLQLDTDAFNTCLDSGQFAEEVQKDFEDGQAAGVSGTPAFFINGRMVAGALPFDAFSQIIDEELERAGVEPPAKEEAEEVAKTE